MTTDEEVIDVLEARLAEQERIYQQARKRADQLRIGIQALRGELPAVASNGSEAAPSVPRLPLAEMLRRAIGDMSPETAGRAAFARSNPKSRCRDRR